MVTVSFDFDGVLHRSTYQGSIEPIHWTEWEDMVPFLEMHDAVRKYAMSGARVICVTARPEMSAVTDFIRHYGLPISEVYYTNGQHKREVLKREGVVVHFDDSPFLFNDMFNSPTRVVLVQPHED